MFSGYSRFDQKSFGCQGCEFTLRKDRCNVWDLILYSLNVCIIVFLCKFIAGYADELIQERLIVYYAVLIAILCVSLMLILSSQTQSESLLVMASIGISIKTVNGLGSVTTAFFCVDQIHDVCIIEAISLQSVVCYLAIVLKEGKENKQKIFPVFKGMKPTLKTLQLMYRNIQTVLHQPSHPS